MKTSFRGPCLLTDAVAVKLTRVAIQPPKVVNDRVRFESDRLRPFGFRLPDIWRLYSRTVRQVALVDHLLQECLILIFFDFSQHPLWIQYASVAYEFGEI